MNTYNELILYFGSPDTLHIWGSHQIVSELVSIKLAVKISTEHLFPLQVTTTAPTTTSPVLPLRPHTTHSNNIPSTPSPQYPAHPFPTLPSATSVSGTVPLETHRVEQYNCAHFRTFAS
ncbi:uncharacterized protein BDZ99DRAFT_284800 [Mytilinidion resinicola]|uniref:Uncharacterized protein n=1 Tax=Mytilinidion resinicola TaxID=574789 RepID=A0A6A6YTX2_9PEZI|nr:uncharacterized protein BDZ99DRAFT_284800 [Mytilinidion resinicola]KAF2811979.1 hypothetical protein BDZ99DRAFT_284800 [Mytilinidion resinicola]